MGCFDNHGAAMLDSRVWNTRMSKNHFCLQQCDCIYVLYDQLPGSVAPCRGASAMTPVLAHARVRGLHNGYFLHSVPRRGLNAATDVASGTAKSG